MRLDQQLSLARLLALAVTAMTLSGTALAPLAEAERGDRDQRVERGDRGDRDGRGQRGVRGHRGGEQGHRGDRMARLAGGPGEHRGEGHGRRGDGSRDGGRRHDGDGDRSRYRDDRRDDGHGNRGNRYRSDRRGHDGGHRYGYRDYGYSGAPRHLNTLPRHLAPRHAPPPRHYSGAYRRDYYYPYNKPYYRTPRYVDRPFYNRYPRRYYTPRYSIGGRYHHYHGRTVILHDYWRFGLYDPPHGYYWVRDRDREDAILVSVATGAIIGLAIGILAD